MAQVIIPARLDCVVKGQTGNSTLTWEPVASNPCGPFVLYRIFKSPSPFGPFVSDTTITDQSATTFVDFNTSASQTWYYYIQDSFACSGASYTTSDTVENASPAFPVLVNVTVNTDSTITFTWLPSTSPQTRFYIIYIAPPVGQPQVIDTVFGRFNTTYTDSNHAHNPYASTISYTVAAADRCSGDAISSYNTHPKQTILLSYSSAHCDPTISLSWTPDSTMTGGVAKYEILVSRNDSAYVLVDTVDNATLTYSFAKFNDGDSVQIHVVAVSATDSTLTSSSQYLRFIAKVVKPPAYIYITQLSVDTTNNSVDLTWIVDNNSKILEYETYNSQDGINYITLPNSSNGVQQVPVPVARFASNADSTATPQYYPFFYEVQAYDSCMTSTTSPSGEIISLQGTLSDYYQITLNWNKFQLYGANVIRQDLYRDYGTGMQHIHTFDSTATTYIDSVFQLLDQAGEFCYVIQATYYINLPLAGGYNGTQTTLSNIACVDHRPIIYIPNAFVYNGVNNVFRPRIIFGDPVDYTMTIWDRYGGKIFETHDPPSDQIPSKGSWDGTDHGHVVDQGGYPYLIQFTALDGTPIERKGIVLFIKK